MGTGEPSFNGCASGYNGYNPRCARGVFALWLVLIALILLASAVFFIVQGEREVARASRVLHLAERMTISTPAVTGGAFISDKLEGHLVHIQGTVGVMKDWGDSATGVLFPPDNSLGARNPLRLRRTIEYLGWHESAGGSLLEARYNLRWAQTLPASSRFHVRRGHRKQAPDIDIYI